MTFQPILRHYLGSAKASVWNVDFEEQGSPEVRTITNRSIEELHRVFMSEGCHREDYRNWASATISVVEWREILADAGIAARTTRDPCQDLPYLNFRPTQRFLCIQGRVRVCAARLFRSENEQWWPFDYYSNDVDQDELQILRAEAGKGRPFSDGDVYRNLRFCQLHASHRAVFWLNQLSDAKRHDLAQLARRNKPLQTALDRLIPFVGVWQDFSLGVLHRLLTLKANKELLCYLGRIHGQLTGLGLDHPEDLDTETIRMIETLAPSVDTQDHIALLQLSHEGQLFRFFGASERKALVHRLLHTQGRILSLRTFVADTIQLETWAKTLKCILPARLDVEADIESLFRDRFRPNNEHIHIEIKQGIFETFHLNPELEDDQEFRVAYIQLWMWAGRHFSMVTGRAPKKDVGHLKPRVEDNEASVHMLATLADRVGFAAPEIAAALVNDPHQLLTRGFLRRLSTFWGQDFQTNDEVRRLEPQILTLLASCCGPAIQARDIERRNSTQISYGSGMRCGPPSESMLRIYQQCLYAPLLASKADSEAEFGCDPIFLIRDIFKCFFGRIDLVLERLARVPRGHHSDIAFQTRGSVCPTQASTLESISSSGSETSVAELMHRNAVLIQPITQMSRASQGPGSQPSSRASSRELSETATRSIASFATGASPLRLQATTGSLDSQAASASSPIQPMLTESLHIPTTSVAEHEDHPTDQTREPRSFGAIDWFPIRNSEAFATNTLTNAIGVVILLPQGLVHRIQANDLQLLKNLVENQHALVSLSTTWPQYRSYDYVIDELRNTTGRKHVLLAHRKGQQHMVMAETVFEDLKALLESSINSTTTIPTSTQMLSWLRRWFRGL